jgi:hypothetical protein
MKNKLLIIWTFILVFAGNLRADEGMWIPMLIEKYNIQLMQEKGFKLSAEDIYSVNKACMKDAVLRFGGGCTGEIISGDGLVITNHHCGRSYIQRHSSLENDYLTNGFWAMSRKEELQNQGLTVTILKRMEDVTAQVLEGTSETMTEQERNKIINTNIERISARVVKETGLQVQVRPFYMGNQYFLFVNEVFRDVRMVGAPPVTIGNFGSETDNWVWPRHTGDFSLFRIYAGKDNKPADYSPENIPYKPAYFFPISLKGVKEGDFTMVFGYPGTTYQYVPSYHIDMLKNHLNPKLIDIRGRKIGIMEEQMERDPLVRLQYFVKKSGIANAWKKWQGELIGLEKMNTIGEKQDYEARFTEWVSQDPSRKARYGNLLPSYRDTYEKLREYRLVNDFTNEVFGDVEAFSHARSLKTLADLYEQGMPEDAIRQAKENLIASAPGIFKNYDMLTDQNLFAAVMDMYAENIDGKWLTPSYVSYRNSIRSNFAASAESIFENSPFTDQARFVSYIEKFNKSSVARLKKDWLYQMVLNASDFLRNNVAAELSRLNSVVQDLNRTYMAAQMEFETDRIFYPDANSTLRIAYGNVSGYRAKDAVFYAHYTTVDGIMEKDNPEIFDYDVPDKLKELHSKKDYGRYGQDGEMPVCFVANNHTTGGNSGSPVINADGHLIGINFDRAWEGVASDMDFNPMQSRNISIDIRYALFIIDKYAGAGYLLDEMHLIE